MRTKKETTGQLMISIDQFSRTRDSVIMSLSNVQKGLAHVQNGLNDLMNAYIKHTASVLAGEDGTLESLQLPDTVVDAANAATAAALFAANNAAAAAAIPPTAAAADAKLKKRKREKKEKDPNAPKRPLTAAFLYAQSARPVVKRDLEQAQAPGEKLETGAVNIEINKRWNDMPEEEKETWKASYRDSQKKWLEDMAVYEASKGATASHHAIDEQASDEAEPDALDSDADSDSNDEAASDLSPVTKAATPPVANGKNARKRQKTASQPNGSSAPVPIAPTPVQLPRPTAHIAPPASSVEPAAAPVKKEKKRKDKAAAVAPGSEESPDETKKKSKGGRVMRNAEAEPDSPEKESKTVKKRDRSKRKSEATS